MIIDVDIIPCLLSLASIARRNGIKGFDVGRPTRTGTNINDIIGGLLFVVDGGTDHFQNCWAYKIINHVDLSSILVVYACYSPIPCALSKDDLQHR
jgi:hypothetical protein